ncbi:MAG: hypothetical protein ACPGQD_04515 [Planctomycetota bacterium]
MYEWLSLAQDEDGGLHMTFGKWIDTFLEEKGIDGEDLLQAEGPSGLNMIPVGVLVTVMKQAPASETAAIKRTLVAIDFKNGDVKHYLNHLAQAIAQ